MDEVTAADIVAFWLNADPGKWFGKDDALDRSIKSRFLPTQEMAARGELAAWEDTAEGALALVILLDQFSRNMFRNSARAFVADPLARAIARRAVARGFDRTIESTMRLFFYLPFMHSEELADQDRSIELHARLGDAELTRYAQEHRDIVVKFGRFPHRNRLVGRATTTAEQAFLDAGGFAG